MRSWLYLLILIAPLGSTSCSSSDDDDSAATEDTSEVDDDDSSDPDYGDHAYERTDGDIVGCNGIDIHYETWDYTDGEPEATLLFINGRTEYTDKYHHVVDMLFSRPWNVVMYDHYGQGRSGGIRAHADDFDTQHVCDLEKVISELTDSSLPLLVASHSTGGLVATRYMQLHDDVTAAVLGSPLLDMAAPAGVSTSDACGMARTAVASGLGETPYLAFSQRPYCPENDVTHDCGLYNQFFRDPITEIGPPTWGFGVALCDAAQRIQADLPQLTTPVKILQAGVDLVVPTEAQDHFCADLDALSSGSCELQVFDGDFHELFNETDRLSVMASTLDFLEAHLPAAEAR